MCQGILQALLSHLAREADAFRFPSRTALFGKEGLGIGLGTERSLLPGEFNDLTAVELNAWTGDESLLISTSICHVSFSYAVGRFLDRPDGENYTHVIQFRQVTSKAI